MWIHTAGWAEHVFCLRQSPEHKVSLFYHQTPGEYEKLHLDAVCWLQHSLQHNLTHEAENLTLSASLQHSTGYQTSSHSDWQSPLLYVSGQHCSPPRLCPQPRPPHTVHPWLCSHRNHANSTVEYEDDTTLIEHIINNNETLYWEEINKSCKESYPLLNVSETKELTVDFRKWEAKTHTPVYISGAEVPLKYHHSYLGHDISPPWLRKAQKTLWIYRGAIETILTGNIRNWHDSSMPRTGSLYSRRLKPPITALVPSTEHQWHHWG